MIERSAARAEVPVFAESDKPADGLDEARVIDLDLARQMEGARQRQEHWEEVELVLEMWEKVARSWENDTLMRLARYARLEAETEKDLERKTR